MCIVCRTPIALQMALGVACAHLKIISVGSVHMEPKSYPMVLAEYGNRFGDTPPSILSEEGATELMLRALKRGRPIFGADLSERPDDWWLSPAA